MIQKVHGIQATAMSLHDRFSLMADSAPDHVVMQRSRRNSICSASSKSSLISENYNYSNRLIEQVTRRLEKRQAMRGRVGYQQGGMRRFGSDSNLPGLVRSNSFGNLSQQGMRSRLSWRQSNNNLSETASLNNALNLAWRGKALRGYKRRALRGKFIRLNKFQNGFQQRIGFQNGFQQRIGFQNGFQQRRGVQRRRGVQQGVRFQRRTGFLGRGGAQQRTGFLRRGGSQQRTGFPGRGGAQQRTGFVRRGGAQQRRGTQQRRGGLQRNSQQQNNAQQQNNVQLQDSGAQAQPTQRPQVARRGGARGRGRGAVTRSQTLPQLMTKEQLDAQLDQYMACTKSKLDQELEEYMRNAMELE